MKRLISLIPIILSIVCIIFIDYNKSYTKDEYDLLKDQIELISWIFACIMGIVSFFGLFIGFVHENKLIVASKILQELYLPYTSSIETIRQNLISYKYYYSRDKIIKFIYYSYLIVSCITIVVWGTAVGFYTKFQFSINIQFTLEVFINVAIYVVYFVLCSLLIGVTFILQSILLRKNPLGDGYLPAPNQVIDLDYLSKQQIDLDELILKTSPILEFYKNPPINNPKYEVNLVLPIKWKNLKFIINLFDEDKNCLIKIYGCITQMTFIGEKYTFCLENNLPEEIYTKLLSGINGELKVYSIQNEIISRLFFSPNNVDNSASFSYSSERIVEKSRHDLDSGIIESLSTDDDNVHFEPHY